LLPSTDMFIVTFLLTGFLILLNIVPISTNFWHQIALARFLQHMPVEAGLRERDCPTD
jgi:hypothetical protein